MHIFMDINIMCECVAVADRTLLYIITGFMPHGKFNELKFYKTVIQFILSFGSGTQLLWLQI